MDGIVKKYENVVIRTKRDLEKSNPHIVEAMEEINPEKSFSVVFQPDLNRIALDVAVDKIIGSVTNIHQNTNGDYIGTCYINETSPYHRHFAGVIDNIVVSLNLDSSTTDGDNKVTNRTIERFVVYDIDEKLRIDKLKTQAPSITDAPIPNEENLLKSEEVQKSIKDAIDEFKAQTEIAESLKSEEAQKSIKEVTDVKSES